MLSPVTLTMLCDAYCEANFSQLKFLLYLYLTLCMITF